MFARIFPTVLLFASFLIASAATAADQSAMQPPDIVIPHLFDIGGGRRLHMVCVGTGWPTVVFEQGGEGNILNWRKVQPAISALTRTCFYDRAGFGWSDPAPLPLTGLSETNDLHSLLRVAHVVLPVILVGHSIGGYYATLYTDRFRNDVAGLVLVDPGLPDQTLASREDWTRYEREAARRGDAALLRCAELARAGKITAHSPPCFTMAAGHPRADVNYLLHGFTRAAWFEAEASLSENFDGYEPGDSVDAREEEAVRRSFGDLPLIVLSASHAMDSNLTGMGDQAFSNEQAFQEFLARRKKIQADLAMRSTQGESRDVPNTGHFIQLDQPQAVIDAITQVVDNVRQSDRDLRGHTGDGPDQ